MMALLNNLIPASLERTVENIWYADQSNRKTKRIDIPQGKVTLIFEFDRGGAIKDAYMIGLFDSFHRVIHRPKCSIIGIQFYPGAASAILPCSVSLLSNQRTYLLDFLKGNLKDIIKPCEANLASPGLRAMHTIDWLERMYLKNNSYNHFGSRVICTLLNDIRKYQCVDDMVQHSGYSQRQLTRLFHANVGTSPKGYLQIIKFQHLLIYWQLTNDLDFALQQTNYYDYSHALKHFNKFTSMTPSDFIKYRYSPGHIYLE